MTISGKASASSGELKIKRSDSLAAKEGRKLKARDFLFYSTVAFLGSPVYANKWIGRLGERRKGVTSSAVLVDRESNLLPQ